MPPSTRRARRPSFGGNLLNVPQPLPDDEAPVPSGQDSAAPPADGAGAPTDPTAPPSAGEQQTSAVGAGNAARGRAPGTIRLTEDAAAQLWASYVEAKNLDPFLSYRKFASSVILDGLATARHP